MGKNFFESLTKSSGRGQGCSVVYGAPALDQRLDAAEETRRQRRHVFQAVQRVGRTAQSSRDFICLLNAIFSLCKSWSFRQF